jgi:hypothetical protein
MEFTEHARFLEHCGLAGNGVVGAINPGVMMIAAQHPMAAAIGACLMYLILPGLGTVSNSIGARAPQRRPSAWKWFVLTAMYSVCLLIIFTAPFQWLNDPARIAKRWRNLWNIPFGYSKYWSDPLEALSDVMRKLILFAILAAVLAQFFASLQSPLSV